MYNVVIVEDEELVRRGIVTAVNWASVELRRCRRGSRRDGLAVIRRQSSGHRGHRYPYAGHGRL